MANRLMPPIATVSGPQSDHNGVTIRVAAPGRVVRVKRPRRVYPPPSFVTAQAELVIADFIQSASERVATTDEGDKEQHQAAQQLATWWDEHKTNLRQRLLMTYKTTRQTMTASYRQRLRRLQERLDLAIAQDHSPPGDTYSVSNLRAQVARCRLEWQRSKRERLIRAHLHNPTSTSKRFFARISTKFTDNTIFALGGSARHSPARSQELAEDMAAGWRPLTQREQTDAFDADTFLDTLERPAVTADLSPLSAPITESEVVAAIKKCQRGKASGPDEIGNCFYRDHVGALAPILAHLYDAWFAAGIAPASFGTANVQCLRKSACASRPLDHRPIALLNSDYKIYTKIFATRMRRLLPTLIDPAQAGFVPGRVIATAIDTLHATQLTATMNPDQADSIALLLDVAKAYDSLHRPYMLRALRWHGLPERFVAMVASLHASTSSRFVVNGFLSRPIAVTCGIRQGCPLAPLLFILALDPLRRMIRACPHLRGIVLSTDEHSTELKTCGYADDTAVYLRDAAQVKPALHILDSFATASGLAINRTKSIILPLNARSTMEQTTIHGLRVLGPDEHCRYLGIQVGRSDASAANWEACFHSLKVRLALAQRKTHSTEQRAQLAKVIIVPKVLYVARHSWPPQQTIERLHQMIKSFV